MAFLAPLMLLGLAALALPIIIHLLDRTRSEPLDWPTLRFLRIARQQSAQRARLKHLLVLLARLLLLAALILAMAMPYREDRTWGDRPELPATVVIVLDHSYSMGYQRSGGAAAGGDATRLARAKTLALEQLSQLKLEDEAALVLVSDRATVLTEAPTRDHDLVRRLIREAELSNRGSDLSAGLAAAFTVGNLDSTAPAPPSGADDKPAVVARKRDAWRHVVLITDMQASAWSGFIRSSLLQSTENPLPVTVIDVSGGETSNRFVRQARIKDQASTGKLVVEAELVSQGPSVGGQATLWLDGRRVGSPELIPAGVGWVTFAIDLPAPGTHEGWIELDEDRLPIDDRHHLAIEVGAGGELVVVDGDPSQVRTLSETYFLDAALSVAQGGGLTIKRMTPTELSASPLGTGGGLILANVPRLDGAALTRVENFLRAGGNVLVALGDKIDLDHYNQQWRFLGIRLERFIGDPSRTRSYLLMPESSEHRLFAGGLDLSAARFFALVLADPTTLPPSGRVLAWFSNGAPGMVETTFGDRGQVLVLTTALDADWSNLPYRRVYVPLVDRLTGYLTQQQVRSLSAMMGQPVKFTGPATLNQQPVSVTDPSGQARTVIAALEPESGSAVAVYDETEQAGLYRISADPGFAAGGALAVNLDTRESILTLLEPEQLKRVFGLHPLRLIHDAPQTLAGWDLAGQEERARRTEYWPALLLLALVLFVLETLLANLFTRRRAPVPPQTTEYLGARRTELLTGHR